MVEALGTQRRRMVGLVDEVPDLRAAYAPPNAQPVLVLPVLACSIPVRVAPPSLFFLRSLVRDLALLPQVLSVTSGLTRRMTASRTTRRARKTRVMIPSRALMCETNKIDTVVLVF